MEISRRIPLDDKSAARSQASVECRWSEGQPLPFTRVSGAFSLSLSLSSRVTVFLEDDSRLTSLQKGASALINR